MDDGLTKAEIVELSGLEARRWQPALAAHWALMLGCLELGVLTPLWSWPLWFVLMGCLLNGMILWTHEGAHVNLYREKPRNDRFADLVICGPIGVYLDSYRWHHGRHHRYLGDPTREIELSAYYCIRGASLATHVARHLFGVVAFTIIFRRQRFSAEGAPVAPPPPRSRAAYVGFAVGNAALLALCVLQGAWYGYLALWVAPLFTLAPMISNFRTIVEHQPSSDVCDAGMHHPVPPISRIVDCGPIERYLVAPVGFYYHYEHHLYPGIPHYNLAEVRRRLEARGHYDNHPMVRSRGYVRSVWNLATDPDFGVRFWERP